MVAITVILAAVIGTFVLGLGDQVQQTTPQAQFGFDQSTQTYGNITADTVTVTHESGDTVSESEIDVTIEGDSAFDVTSNNKTAAVWNESDDISAGSSIRVVGYTTADSPSGTDLTNGTSDPEWKDGGEIESGGSDSWTAIDSGDTIRVVYNNPDSDKTATLAKYEVS